MCTWAIKTLLSPKIQIDKKLVGIDNIESIVLKRFNSPMNEIDSTSDIPPSIFQPFQPPQIRFPLITLRLQPRDFVFPPLKLKS